MIIEIKNLTKAQEIALEDMLATWQYLGGIGSSRWTAFYADGDGNFRPQITIDGKKPQKETVMREGSEAKRWKKIKVFDEYDGRWYEHGDAYFMDFDPIAWALSAQKEG